MFNIFILKQFITNLLKQVVFRLQGDIVGSGVFNGPLHIIIVANSLATQISLELNYMPTSRSIVYQNTHY